LTIRPSRVETHGISSPAVKVVAKEESPKSPGEIQPARTPSSASSPGGHATLVKAAAELGVAKILIVEDNIINQRALSRCLTRLGLEVDMANHGLETLEILSTTSRDLKAAANGNGVTADGEAVPIDMILMDVEMPVMDGLTCTRNIRKLEAGGDMVVSLISAGRTTTTTTTTTLQTLPHVPIIALTANARSEQIQAALDAGCDDVILKPYRVPELVAKMREVLERVRRRQELVAQTSGD